MQENDDLKFSQMSPLTKLSNLVKVPVIKEKVGVDGTKTYENFLLDAVLLNDMSGVSSFDTVKDMLASDKLTKGTVALTRGYHKAGGIGKAAYDIWDLNEYRLAINNDAWLPDAEEVTIDGKVHYAGADHLLQNGLVAKLRYEMLWAGQCGLEDPVEDEVGYVSRKANHDFGLQKAVDFAKLELSTNKSNTFKIDPDTGEKHSQNGIGVRRNIILHVEQGRYVLTKTCWVPANVYLCGGDTWACGNRCVDFIPLKPHLGGSISNYVRNFMFIFNGNRDHVPTEAVPMGATPMEQIYISPYVGGMSSISLNNYETDYGLKPDGSKDWYKPNYLKKIRGCMVFGGGRFESTSGERIWMQYHRPGVDWLDFYTDGWYISDYKSNTPIENEEYQFDFNGSGDIIKIDGVQFPVNHPPEDKTQPFPDGEYPNGVVKGIKFHNFASWDIRPPGQGGSQEMIGYVGAASQICRVINGEIASYGYRELCIEACHLEFGKIHLEQGSALVKGCYFSKITGANYPSIVCRKGQYGGIGSSLILEGCEFHRGFDGAHLPVEENQYDLVIDENYTVTVRDCFQGWDTAGSNQEVAITVGIYKDLTETEVIPLPGWKRWAPYLSRECRIVRGKIPPLQKDIFWNGFEGVQEVLCVESRSPRSWDIEKGIKYYYYAQYVADIGDETTSPDFVPLGKNQRERNIYLNGVETNERFEAGVVVKEDAIINDGKNPPYTTHYRPLVCFYGENDTSDQGFVRLYRGTSPYQYSHFVDLPLLSRSTVDDYGTTCFGRKWQPNPVPVDTNTDLSKRKRNLLPVTGSDFTQYKLFMRGGVPTTDKVEMSLDFYGRKEFVYYGTGYWKNATENTVIRASNESTVVVAEGSLNNVAIFDRPFTKDVYAVLPLTGAWNWNKTRQLKIEKGTAVKIIRTPDTLPAGETKETKPLYVQTEDASGKNVVLYNMGAGEIVFAVYDEKEVKEGENYVTKGEWTIVKGAVAEDYVNPFYFVEAAAGQFVRLLPPKRNETLAIFDFVNNEEIYGAVPQSAELGSRVKIVRSDKQVAALNVLVKDADDQNLQTIPIFQTNATINLLRKQEGWVIESVLSNIDTATLSIDGKQYFDLTPRNGSKKSYFFYSTPIAKVTDDVCILRLEHASEGKNIVAGAYVRLFRMPTATYDGTLTVIVNQTRDGATEKELIRFTTTNTWIDFVYDGANWLMLGNNIVGGGQKTNYLTTADKIKFFGADVISANRTFINYTNPVATGDTGYVTLDDAAEIGTEVYISFPSAVGDVIVQTQSGTICTVTGKAWANAIKIADGTGPDKWMVQHK